MRILAIVALALSLFISSFSHAYFYSGNDLKKWIDARERIDAGRSLRTDHQADAALMGYIMGVYDSLEMDLGVNLKKCWMGRNPTVGQLTAIVSKYLKEHPEKWTSSAVLIITEAITDACKKNQSAK